MSINNSVKIYSYYKNFVVWLIKTYDDAKLSIKRYNLDYYENTLENTEKLLYNLKININNIDVDTIDINEFIILLFNFRTEYNLLFKLVDARDYNYFNSLFSWYVLVDDYLRSFLTKNINKSFK